MGDLVLKWDKAHEKKGKHTKFQSMWIRPFFVHDNLGHHTYCLQSLDGNMEYRPPNGQAIKHYFK